MLLKEKIADCKSALDKKLYLNEIENLYNNAYKFKLNHFGPTHI